jgi:hypothetical protein
VLVWPTAPHAYLRSGVLLIHEGSHVVVTTASVGTLLALITAAKLKYSLLSLVMRSRPIP